MKSETVDEIRVLGLAVLATDRVVATLPFHMRTKKRRDRIRKAILCELRRERVSITIPPPR